MGERLSKVVILFCKIIRSNSVVSTDLVECCKLIWGIEAFFVWNWNPWCEKQQSKEPNLPDPAYKNNSERLFILMLSQNIAHIRIVLYT